MIEHELPLDENMGESFPSMQFDFPYIWFWGELDHYIGGHVPWHWHDEPEFCHVLQGEVEYHFPNQVYVLTAGDAMFVNSNVLHMICPHNGCQNTIIIPQVFNKLLLIGYHRSAIDTKYYRPIVNSQTLPCYFMSHADEVQSTMVKLLDNCYKCAEQQAFGYEVQVRNFISIIWMQLYSAVGEILRPHESKQDKNNIRLKQMLFYISQHYAEKIALKEIADAACISERECIRCFKKHMQVTPFQYLLDYRIDAAANMLLHSDCTITEAALHSGFETSSYFSKIFKQHMHCTPKEYRDTRRQNFRLTSRIKNQPDMVAVCN